MPTGPENPVGNFYFALDANFRFANFFFDNATPRGHTHMRRKLSPPMNRTDALATIAYCVLSTRGQTTNPTLHDITLAVVQASPLLDITIDSQAARIQLAAADQLIRRHKWKIGSVVLLRSPQERLNSFPKTTTAHPKVSR